MILTGMNETLSLQQEADLAMGEITKTLIREMAVDFSYPYFVTRVGFFTSKPYPLPRIRAIIWPLETYLWLCLGMTLPIFSLVYWILATFQSGSGNVPSGQLVSHVVQIFLWQSKQDISSLFLIHTKRMKL